MEKTVDVLGKILKHYFFGVGSFRDQLWTFIVLHGKGGQGKWDGYRWRDFSTFSEFSAFFADVINK